MLAVYSSFGSIYIRASGGGVDAQDAKKLLLLCLKIFVAKKRFFFFSLRLCMRHARARLIAGNCRCCHAMGVENGMVAGSWCRLPQCAHPSHATPFWLGENRYDCCTSQLASAMRCMPTCRTRPRSPAE